MSTPLVIHDTGSTFHNILVAYDGSAHAEAALQLAIELAQKHNAALGIVHAYQHVADVLGIPNFDEFVAAVVRIGEEVLTTARAQVPAGIVAETHLLEGPAAHAILRVAETRGYDLIVIGSRGRGQMSSLLLGSVSTVVAQRAHCHVLIAHGLSQTGAADEKPTTVVQTVLPMATASVPVGTAEVSVGTIAPLERAEHDASLSHSEQLPHHMKDMAEGAILDWLIRTGQWTPKEKG
jgi:nucleotide-binding universal stress UspA family protein